MGYFCYSCVKRGLNRTADQLDFVTLAMVNLLKGKEAEPIVSGFLSIMKDSVTKLRSLSDLREGREANEGFFRSGFKG
jgi:hypothetical protein